MDNINQRAKIFEQKLLQKKAEMEQCDHLFVKIQEDYWIGGFHSSDYEYTPCTVKCLKCGLTNYHINMDVILRKKYSDALEKINPQEYCWLVVNDDVFRKQFSGINWKKHNSKDIFNLISDEVLPTTDSVCLYQTARQINPDASDKELFEIMKELFETKRNEIVKTKKRSIE